MDKNLAHETLKSFVENTDNVIVKNAVLVFHPELAESEDERIRKNLIEWIREFKKLNPTDPDHNAECSEALDWLKRQGDASRATEAIERIDKYIDEHTANAHEMSDSNSDKKYYRGWDDALSNISGILQDVYSNESQKEQKLNEELGQSREQFDKHTQKMLDDIHWYDCIGKFLLDNKKTLKPSYSLREVVELVKHFYNAGRIHQVEGLGFNFNGNDVPEAESRKKED